MPKGQPAEEGVAFALARGGPWCIEMRIGSELARQLGGTGRLAGLDLPEKKLGPFVLSFDLRGFARLSAQSADQHFAPDVLWTLDRVSNQELSQMSLPPGTVFMELRFSSEEGIPMLDDAGKADPSRAYIPGGQITASTYVRQLGISVGMSGASAVTINEEQWFVLTEKKIVGCVSRFDPAVDDRSVDLDDPELQRVILDIKRRLRDVADGGSSGDQQRLLKTLLREWHPDRQPERPTLAAGVFRWLQSAREELGEAG